MSRILRKISRETLQFSSKSFNNTKKNLTTYANHLSTSQKILWGTLGVIGAGGVVVFIGLERSVSAGDLTLHPPKLPWSHKGLIASYDHASIRRGYEVYKQVCSACHSMKKIYYHNLINVTHTEAEAKEEAKEIEVIDGPDEEGNMFKRPGKLTDHFPSPYPNREAARFANNGALPPDLSYIVYGRHGAEDYIFSLLTGYCDPPAGVKPGEGQHFNPYFLGGLTSMAQALFNEVIEYADGTPATASQMAKDVCTFLAWASGPELDERKQMFIKFILIWSMVAGTLYYVTRHKWSTMRSRKIAYKPPRNLKK